MKSRIVMRDGKRERQVKLTPQEIAVGKLVYEDVENKEIAARLNLAHGTVAGYLSKLHAGLPVRNRGELKTWFYQHEVAQARLWVDDRLHPPGCPCERCAAGEAARAVDGCRPVR